MGKSYLIIRINEELYSEFQKYCESLNVSVSSCIEKMAKTCVEKNIVPFPLFFDAPEYSGEVVRKSLFMNQELRDRFSIFCKKIGFPKAIFIKKFMAFCLANKNNSFEKFSNLSPLITTKDNELKDVVLNIKVSSEKKKLFSELCKTNLVNSSFVIGLFVNYCVRYKDIPSEIDVSSYNYNLVDDEAIMTISLNSEKKMELMKICNNYGLKISSLIKMFLDSYFKYGNDFLYKLVQG